MKNRPFRGLRTPSPRIHAALLLAAVGVAAALSWVPAQAADERQPPLAAAGRFAFGVGYPNFDARLSPAGVADARCVAAIETARKTPAGAARAAAIKALADTVPGLTVDDEQFTGSPGFVRSTRAFLSAPQPGLPPRAALTRFLLNQRDLFELHAEDLVTARATRTAPSRHNGVTHLTLQQTLAGVDVFGGVLRATVAADGSIVNAASAFVPGVAGTELPKPAMGPEAAIVAAAMSVGIAVTEAPRPTEAPEGDARHNPRKASWAPTRDFRDDEPVTTELVYFPRTRTDLRAAYLVLVPAPGPGHTYEIVVDAADGSLLWRHDRMVFESTQPASYRVYTSDSPAPGSPGLSSQTGFQFPFVDRELVTVLPADITPFSPNGWIDDGVFETRGNNVDAHTDVDGNNQPDLPRPTSATRVFDFPLDVNQEPATYRDAAATQLFYLANIYHDRLYALGFDEASGNFQINNFGRGGTGNDPVQADAQDNFNGGAANNANFGTGGADGSTARMQMYVFTAPTPDRDGDLDADIVFHELTHGTSIRLHGGLSGSQSGGQGEGWSDFFGIALLSQPGDNPNLPYTTGGYATYQLFSPTFFDNYYSGIRRYPYSVDLNINPLTFADIDANQFSVPANVPRNTAITTSPAAVHNTGEVWCNTLLEGRTALWNAQGFSGNQRMMQLVVDGMKLAPGNPNFVQSRDAIIQADLVNNAAANTGLLWGAFAKRGLGSNATSPPSSTNTGVVESFSVPQYAGFSFPDGLPNQLEPGTSATFRVSVVGVGLDLSPNSGRIVASVNGAPATTTPLTQTSPGEYVATLTGQPCGTRVAYSFLVGTSLGDRADPGTGIYNAAWITEASTEVVPVLSDDFEAANPGWTTGPDTATTGAWERGNPIATTAQPEDDHTPGPGVNCWFTGQQPAGNTQAGANDVDGGVVVLTSPTIDLSGKIDATFSYWRWYSNGLGGAPFADTFRVDVSVNNGATWTNGETVGPGGSGNPDVSPGWRQGGFSLSAIGLTPTSQVRIRFIADDAGSGSLIEAAIDDFVVTGRNCLPSTPTCPADYNLDTSVTPDDLADFIADFFDSIGTQAGFPGPIPIPGGFAGTSTLAYAGFGVPCPGAPDVPQPNPWSAPIDAYRTGGYKCNVGLNNGPCAAPNGDDLADYIGIFFTPCP
jgi:hypothetical protein